VADRAFVTRRFHVIPDLPGQLSHGGIGMGEKPLQSQAEMIFPLIVRDAQAVFWTAAVA